MIFSNIAGECSWTLPQALAWIIYKSDRAVEKTRKSRESCFDVVNNAVRQSDILILAWDQKGSATDARAKLLEALMKGVLVAFGIPHSGNRHIKIPCEEWRTIESLNTAGIDFAPDEVRGVAEDFPRYRSVYVVPDEVRKIFPAVEASNQGVSDASETKQALAAGAVNPRPMPAAKLLPSSEEIEKNWAGRN